MLKNKEIHTFNIRIPRDLWKKLRIVAFDREQTMNSILVELISKNVEKKEKKLTSRNAKV